MLVDQPGGGDRDYADGEVAQQLDRSSLSLRELTQMAVAPQSSQALLGRQLEPHFRELDVVLFGPYAGRGSWRPMARRILTSSAAEGVTLPVA